MKLEAKAAARDYLRGSGSTNVFRAVQPTDFVLPQGCLTAILGRSGSGKTTLLQMLAGLLTPSAGKVLLDGEDFYRLPDDRRSLLRNRSLGIVPQGHTGLQNLTVLENVLVPAAMTGNAGQKREQALASLERMGIGGLAEVYANELSGGELRRMAIARALVNDPPILIADEPTSDLDERTAQEVFRLMRERADHGTGVLMVTHENDAADYADEVYEMEQGKLRQCLL